MTHSAALQGPALNGQDIGQAEHATRAVLDRLLARTGIQFHSWVIINQLAASGGALGEDELTGRITITKIITLVINLAVVGYLLFAKRLFGLRGGGRAVACVG